MRPLIEKESQERISLWRPESSRGFTIPCQDSVSPSVQWGNDPIQAPLLS